MKQNADERRRAKPLNLDIGDIVLVRQRKRNKFTTRFDPRPFEVVRNKGTMVTACRDGRYITRNISQFKVIDPSFKEPSSEDNDSIDDDNLSNDISVEAPVPPPVPAANPVVRRSIRKRNAPERYETLVF